MLPAVTGVIGICVRPASDPGKEENVAHFKLEPGSFVIHLKKYEHFRNNSCRSVVL